MKCLFYFLLGLILGNTTVTFNKQSKWTAKIKITDAEGNIVKSKKPSVVCLAESPKENLICRVESVE